DQRAGERSGVRSLRRLALDLDHVGRARDTGEPAIGVRGTLLSGRIAATSAYHATYSSGGTGLNPLVESYSLCVAYGGDVIAICARELGLNNLPSVFRSRQSPQTSMCFPICHRSPGRVTGLAGSSGISSLSSGASCGSSLTSNA